MQRLFPFSSTYTAVSRGGGNVVKAESTAISAAEADTSNTAEVEKLPLSDHADTPPKAPTIVPTLVPTAASLKRTKLLQNLLIGFYFLLWYALNVMYNILNKKVLNALPAPMIVGSLQLGTGAAYVGLLWALQLRPRPIVSTTTTSGGGASGRHRIRVIGLAHGAGQLCTTLALGAAPVSFTHIVKAMEPFFSAGVSICVSRQFMAPAVYLALVPVVGGVSYACLKESAFSWLAFLMAMSSNLAFAFRAVLSKAAMKKGSSNQQQQHDDDALGSHLTAANLYGLVTVTAFWWSLPVAILMEGGGFGELWAAAHEAGVSSMTQEGSGDGVDLEEDSPYYTSQFALTQAVVLSGLFHYLNNEVMFLALSKVHPVTLAVGNTLKRVFIMVASVMVFHNHISGQAATGAAVGIGGALVYSLTKQHYERQAQQLQQPRKTLLPLLPPKY